MNIAIAGYGMEGEASYRYWSTQPGNSITILDERADALDGVDFTGSEPVASRLGQGAFDDLGEFDMVLRTAGLSVHKLKSAKKIWSITNEFFAQCPVPIIGVTGTKGKGTTSSLVASILEAAGRKVHLVGNIGVASIDTLKDMSPSDIVVYELAGFQLWDIEYSPQTAVVLFIAPEHLNVFTGMDEYVQAKAGIARFQRPDDRVIFNSENSYARQIAESSIAQKIAYPSGDYAHVRDGVFYYGEVEICPTSSLSILGEHNIQNALAAIDAAWPFVQNVQQVEEGLHSFKGLPHRLSFVDMVDGVDYYDDSIATTPAASIAALRAFPGKQKVIILGGSSKGAVFTDLAEELLRHDVHALLIGDEAESIAAACTAAGFINFDILGNASADDIVQRARELAKQGGVVLLSPAAASFGMYKDYKDRGDQFQAAVRNLR